MDIMVWMIFFFLIVVYVIWMAIASMDNETDVKKHKDFYDDIHKEYDEWVKQEEQKQEEQKQEEQKQEEQKQEEQKHEEQKQEERDTTVSVRTVQEHEECETVDFIRTIREEYETPVYVRPIQEQKEKKLNEAKQKINAIVDNYILQFYDYDVRKDIGVIYSENKKNGIVIANTVLQYAKRNVKIDSLFPGDTTQLYLAVFPKHNYDYVEILLQFIKKGAITGTILFYGISNEQYRYCFNLYNEGRRVPDYYDPALIGLKKMKDSLGLHDVQLGWLIERMRYNIEEYCNNLNNYVLHSCILNQFMCRNIVNGIYTKFYQEGIYFPKWEREYKLYTIACKYFNDTIYQYKSDWLGAQSIDIYIPCIRLAIEYQGEQHYHAVDYFGGEEKLLKQQENDKKKRNLCQENQVMLLEWPFSLDVNDINFCVKIKEKIGKEPQKLNEQESNQANDFLEGYRLNCVYHKYSDSRVQEAIECKNMCVVYKFVIYCIRNGKNEYLDLIFNYMVDHYEKNEMKVLLKTIVERKKFMPEIVHVIIINDKLLNYFMDVCKKDPVSWSIIYEMIREKMSFEKIQDCIKYIKRNYYSLYNHPERLKEFASVLLDYAKSDYEIMMAKRIIDDISYNRTVD